MDATQWDNSYMAGSWRYLANIDEAAHYGIISAYLRDTVDRGTVLDVGCGEAILFRHLHPLCVGEYVGLDWSPVALAKAKLSVPTGRFRCSDLNTYITSDRFDAIVFNEILYYCESPVDILNQYRHFLKESGIIVVSMWTNSPSDRELRQRSRMVLAALDLPFWTAIGSSEVRNISDATTWQVKVARVHTTHLSP